MLRKALSVGACAVGAMLALLGPAQAGATIVYRHGTDIWAMNDDGSGVHALVTAANFAGVGPWTIGHPDVLPNGDTIVLTATTQAYDDGPSGGPAGACGLDCSGTYELVNNTLTRLTAAAAPCGASQQWCTSFETEPRLTADGLVAYQYFITTWQYSCVILPCSWSFVPGGSATKLETRSVSDGSGVSEWTHSTGSSNNQSLSINPYPTPDPADPTLMAYAEDISCNPTCLFDVHVGNRDGTLDRVVVGDDAPFHSLAWTSDGSALIDVEAGTQAGIWTYDPTATNPSKTFTWLLADPQPYNSSNPYSTSIGQARYMAPGQVLFDQNADLYDISLSACASSATTAAAGCTMSDATRLTSNGDNHEAVWTSAALSTGSGTSGSTGTGGSTGSGGTTGTGGSTGPGGTSGTGGSKGTAVTTRCVVPRLIGLTVVKARRALPKAHCGLGRQSKAYSAKIKRGRIMTQATRPGEKLTVGAKVAITVSKGTKPRRRR